MQLKSIHLILLFACAILFLNSCSDNETSLKETYTFGDYTGSLSNAKIYWGVGDLNLEGTNDDFTYRTYFISDGDFEEGGDPWNPSDYIGSTYYMAIELYVPSTSNFVADDYPSWRINWMAPAGEPFSYFEVFLGPNQDNERFQSVINDTAVLTVSGKFDGGEKMTLNLTGQLGFIQNLPGGGWTETGMKDVSLNVTRNVIDIRQN